MPSPGRGCSLLLLLALLALLGCTATPAPAPTSALGPGPAIDDTAAVPSAPNPGLDTLLPLISPEQIRAHVAALTAIQSNSGWRNAGTQGEEEAFDYVATQLDTYSSLRNSGMEWEKENVRLLLSTEIWESGLQLTVGGRPFSVPAAGLAAPADHIAPALRFDSDGALNDAQPNPLTVEGPVALLRTTEDLAALRPAGLSATVALLDYAAIDPTQMDWATAVDRAATVLAAAPAGLVVITHYSDQPGESHGTFAGDASPLAYIAAGPRPVTLVARLEDLAPAGLTIWDDLAQIQSARLTWDADVFSPAATHNLVARIPGADPAHAVILTAHIDSANNPGAMDDASGAAALLEVARVLDVSHLRPPTDLYLVWFGAEESGLVGSYAFAAAHSELLDSTLLMMAADCPSRPLPGISASLRLEAWSSGRPGDDRERAPLYVSGNATHYGLEVVPGTPSRSAADNLPFATFNVPGVQLIYTDPQAMEDLGGFYYAGHIHDPYDTAAQANEEVTVRMAGLALVTALETGHEQPVLRASPPVQHRALLVGSHTEAVQTSPANFADLAAALTRAGYDVDAVPYGRAVTPADLAGTDLVIVLPVLDYPAPDWNVELYDETWGADELTALDDYVASGGLLVLTNSADALDFSGRSIAPNEDWNDMNVLARRFGVTYGEVFLAGRRAQGVAGHPLLAGVTGLEMMPGNGVGFALEKGTVLATTDDVPAVALVSYGNNGGQVLVLADVWMLAAGWEGENAMFWENLGAYAGDR